MTPRPQYRNIAGMLTLALGIFVFSTQDAIIKAISGEYAVTQAIVIRSVVSLPILAALVQAEVGIGALATRNFRALLARGAILLVSYTTYYMAFPALPLAEAIALYSLAPVFITLLAPPLLGERVGLRSWGALGIGFAGVLLILRPGAGLFEPAALLSLVSAMFYALAMALARKFGTEELAGVMAFYQNAVYGVGALVIALICKGLGLVSLGHPSLDFLVRPWATPSLRDLVLMGLCGVIAAVAMSLLTQAYRMAEAKAVAVVEYTVMIWAPLWGYLIFAETPRLTTLAGMAFILAAGLYGAGFPGRLQRLAEPASGTL